MRTKTQNPRMRRSWRKHECGHAGGRDVSSRVPHILHTTCARGTAHPVMRRMTRARGGSHNVASAVDGERRAAAPLKVTVQGRGPAHWAVHFQSCDA